MTPCMIGLDAEETKEKLAALGLAVQCVGYQSRRGVEHADSARVIRQRCTGNNSIEITVSEFKTQAD